MKDIYKFFYIITTTQTNCDELFFMIDAEFSTFFQSSLSIEMAVKTALPEVSNEIQGKKVVVKQMDHRGNSKRSKRNIIHYLNNKNALVIYT